MTVYIDDAELPFGRMLMCHMMADEIEELHQFAESIGLRRAWFQNKMIPHYDVSKGKRREAVAAGAKEVSFFESHKDKDLERLMQKWRKERRDK